MGFNLYNRDGRWYGDFRSLVAALQHKGNPGWVWMFPAGWSLNWLYAVTVPILFSAGPAKPKMSCSWPSDIPTRSLF